MLDFISKIIHYIMQKDERTKSLEASIVFISKVSESILRSSFQNESSVLHRMLILPGAIVFNFAGKSSKQRI